LLGRAPTFREICAASSCSKLRIRNALAVSSRADGIEQLKAATTRCWLPRFVVHGDWGEIADLGGKLYVTYALQDAARFSCTKVGRAMHHGRY
jgi:hypothetical protein